MDKPECSKVALSSKVGTRIPHKNTKHEGTGGTVSTAPTPTKWCKSESKKGSGSQNIVPDSSEIAYPTDKRQGAEKDTRKNDGARGEAGPLLDEKSHAGKSTDAKPVVQISENTSQPLHDKKRTRAYSQDQESRETKLDKQGHSSRRDQADKVKEKKKKKNKENRNPSKEQKELEEQVVKGRTTKKLISFTVKEKPKPKEAASILSFSVVDHNDHWHVVFQCSKNDQSEIRRNICKFLNFGSKATAEAKATTHHIRDHEAFGRLLLRSGSDRIKFYGTEHESLERVIRRLVKHGRAAEASELCPDMNRLGIRTMEAEIRRKASVCDSLNKLLDKHNPYSLSKFERSLPRKDFLSLMIDLGSDYTEQVSALIRYRRRKLYDTIQNSSLEENLERVSRRAPNLDSVDWLEYMFQENKIVLAEFLAWMRVICERRIKKLNTLVLQGPINSGKSLVLRSMIQNLNTVYVTKTKDGNSFKLENLLEKNFAILEDPRILPISVDSYKLLLGGEYCGVPVHHSGESLPRIPIFISTYQSLGSFLSFNVGQSIHSRTKTFFLQREIQGVADCSNTPGVSALRPPPLNINEAEWLYLLRRYRHEIEEYVVGIVTMQHSNVDPHTILTRAHLL